MPRRLALPTRTALRDLRARRRGRALAARSVRESLISVAGLIGRPVRNERGGEVGRLVDIVVRWDGAAYPEVSGLVVRVGRRRTYVPVAQIDEFDRKEIRLRSARVDLVDFERREGEVLLATDVLDRQLVDMDGVRVVRAADFYLTKALGGIRLVGVDVGFQSLLRRLGPARWRDRPTPDRVIDWAAIQPFGRATDALRLRKASRELRRLRPAELADLLEELGRAQRQELLAALEPDAAADALEEMEPTELAALLRESPVEQAAALVAGMEPDEAIDALRDLDEQKRHELLEAMPPATAESLAPLLTYPEGEAGGIMTIRLVIVGGEETVAEVRERLRDEAEHRSEIDAVLVVDTEGRLVDDVTLFELCIADASQPVAELTGEPWPVTVTPDTDVREVIERLVESRGSSVVVIDPDGHPIGRILADDVIDALVSKRTRLRFPRLPT